MSVLGEFLQARRAQVRPEDVGLSPIGERRRVPGLRREELAQLAGISVSYYTRLEQGQSRGASGPVLDSIAEALRLDRDEREHLRRLASAPRRAVAARPAPERVLPATLDLLAMMSGVPALVQGRCADVLAWNALGHALLAGHLDADVRSRPNMARLVFLDARTRELYADWPRKARAVVGNLRLAAGRYPDDAALAALIGELSVKSPDFATMWADHRIRPCDAADYELHHPAIGRITLTQQAFDVARAPDQMLVTLTAPPGSPAREALARLVPDEFSPRAWSTLRTS
ncbi:transcriptional regulator [Actinosynnema sp. ALI-1.44]|uniref:helix-turn-helix domain-containing protein n=1 Tax=Actinosynnema sp. ALI-1.44 TaxID=1933779 RepID=UPI00097C87DC|nr:helix-turn-helix transcriptional regulator [Actinosynnema sp. ALI-1.44]ONI75218.1 transcriptional regulator [Actinosynnema sp. ALI-1.44]